MAKLVMVDCISEVRIRFAVRVKDNIDDALKETIFRENDIEFRDFSQVPLGMLTYVHKEIDEEDYLRMFDEDNEHLRNWSLDQKMALINDISDRE